MITLLVGTVNLAGLVPGLSIPYFSLEPGRHKELVSIVGVHYR